MDSFQVCDPVNKRQYGILIPVHGRTLESVLKKPEDRKDTIVEEQNFQSSTTWSRNETLALINIFSFHKDKFNNFKKKKTQWVLISQELSKIGINKPPEKCEIKWKNLLRVYRQHKFTNTGRGKFEFFNELDAIVAGNPRYKYLNGITTGNTIIIQRVPENNTGESSKFNVQRTTKKKACSCEKSEKQKRHEDRMALMVKKMEIEERKVKAFEEYLKFLKSNSNKNKL